MPQRDKHRLLCWLLLMLIGSFTFGAADLAVHGQSGPTPTPTSTNTPITGVTPTPTNTPITAVTPTPTNTPITAVTPTPTNTPSVPIHYRIVYWSLISASGRSQAGRYQISGSAGQAVLGSAVAGNGLQVYSGYWGSQPAPPVATATATLTATPSATPTAVPQATPTPLTNTSISVFLPVVTR